MPLAIKDMVKIRIPATARLVHYSPTHRRHSSEVEPKLTTLLLYPHIRNTLTSALSATRRFPMPSSRHRIASSSVKMTR